MNDSLRVQMQTNCTRFLLTLGIVGCCLANLTLFAGEKIAHSVLSTERLVITADGKPFTEVLADVRGTPILFPLVTPQGVAITRAYPMSDAITDGSSDHQHHRSLWFTHGDVCGVDFWSVDPPNTPAEKRKRGIVREVAREVKADDDSSVVVTTRNDWIAPSEEKEAVLCSDIRTLRFSSVEVGGRAVRQIDVSIEITAARDGVRFGDTKEGTFGIRVHDAMRVKVGNKQFSGTVTNAERLQDDAAWGKSSAWCDYRGEIDGKRVGITVLNHPTSFRFPTYWHVRDYGLFAANPFGVRDFTKSGDGALLLQRGEHFTISYRVLITDGDFAPDAIDAIFQSYTKEKENRDGL